MSITVKKLALTEPKEQLEGKLLSDNYLNIVAAIDVECLIRLGTLSLTIGELRKLQQGQILTLDQKTHEPVDILLNNQVIARGELMTVEDCFAIQITEVAS